MARARTYIAKVPLLGMPSLEDTSRPSLKAGSCKIIEKNSLNGIAACWNSHVSALDIASVVNAFACLFFFSFRFSFIIPFLPGPPFRVFNPPGNIFCCPCFCLNCLLKVVNPSGCSFLPKPPFRVFDLANIFIFHAFHSVFSFLPLTTDHHWEEGLLVTWIGTDINIDLFMHVHSNASSCSGLFSKYLKIFNFHNVYPRHASLLT